MTPRRADHHFLLRRSLRFIDNISASHSHRTLHRRAFHFRGPVGTQTKPMRLAPMRSIVFFLLLRFYDIKIKSRGLGNGQRAFTGYTVLVLYSTGCSISLRSFSFTCSSLHLFPLGTSVGACGKIGWRKGLGHGMTVNDWDFSSPWWSDMVADQHESTDFMRLVVERRGACATVNDELGFSFASTLRLFPPPSFC
jgi:hypothetical protein